MDIRKVWEYANLAYTPEKLPDDVHRMRYGNNSGFYLIDGSTLVVSFQGTGTLSDEKLINKIKDWQSNLSFWDLNSNGVHDGFESGLKPFLPELEIVLTTLSFDKIIFTGHSLGGALAILAAYHFGVDADAISFGAPAQGDQRYANAVNMMKINVVNYVNGWDPVPSYPMKRLGYIHAGKTIRIEAPWWKNIPILRVKFHVPKAYEKAITTFYSK